MVLFELECIQEELNYEQTQLLVKPNTMEICHYVDSREVVNTIDITPTLINDFIAQQTPLLFNVFQNMDNIPLDIRNKYSLP